MCESLRGLMVIDHGGKVRPIHQTARVYLLKHDLKSPFAVSSMSAHSKIANLLVNHLHQRLRNNPRNASQLKFWQHRKAGIDNYALHHFVDHIRRADPKNHALFVATERFFSNCGMGWIACIALAGSLSPLVRTSQNLRTWLQSRLKETPPIGELARKTMNIQQWSTDLDRIVAKFGRHLVNCPSAIYALIPPFVPKESVFSVSQPRSRDLQVIGLGDEKWDDRLCSIFYDNTCTAVTSGKHNFAVALKSGIVHIYDNKTMQLLRKIQHGAIVKLLKYNNSGSMLLTTGFRKMKMWAIPEGELKWEVAISALRLTAEFIQNGSVLISISSQHKVIRQDVTTGVLLEQSERRPSAGGYESTRLFRRELQYAEFSTEAEMLAKMERERPIQLADIEDKYDLGVVELGSSVDGENETPQQPVTAMTSCANIDIALLAAVYRDGVLAVFDRNLQLIEKRADSKGATLLAGSPNGLHLAAASVEGVITIYDFEQLTHLRTLYTSSIENIRSLVFSGDGNRIIDIRDKQANVWAPTTLFACAREDTDSLSESTLAPTIATSHFIGSKDGVSNITFMSPCPDSGFFLCGREDGTVVVHRTKDAQQHKTVFQDSAKQWLSLVLWEPKTRTLASLSGTSSVIVCSLSLEWSVSRVLMKHTFSHPIKQILIRSHNDQLKIFIVSSNTTHLWALNDTSVGSDCLAEKKVQDLECNGIWIEDASGFLIYAEPEKLSKYNWDMEKLDSSAHITFGQAEGQESTDGRESQLGNVLSFDRGASFLQNARPMLFLRSRSSQNTTLVSPSASTPTKSSGRPRWIIDLSSPNSKGLASMPDGSSSSTAALQASLLPVSHIIEHVIGIVNRGTKLIFLDKNLWICSYNLVSPGVSSFQRPLSAVGMNDNAKPSSQTYTRHFFIPDDWISSNYSNANSQLLFTHSGAKDDSLIFVKKHEVIVIKNPFAHAEVLSIV